MKAAAYSKNNALSPECFALHILNLKSSAEKQLSWL